MRLALIYPPACDPTAPYVSVPLLAGYLRPHDLEVQTIDANAEAFDRLLRPGPLAEIAARLEHRLRRLERASALSHVEQLAYSTLWHARGDAFIAPQQIEQARAVLKDGTGRLFYDPEQYGRAVSIVDAALRAISAAHAPLTLSFAEYRTPFALLSLDAIRADARPERNPFHSYFAGELAPRLVASSPALIGISLAFPGQLQPGYALALVLREQLPSTPLIVGGPAITQLMLGLAPEARERALGPFDAAVLFEGEEALLEIARELGHGKRPRGIIHGSEGGQLEELPAPDFSGLALGDYLAPEPVLPYDVSRGCYWGRCAFCHYGLTAHGTARYRERTPARAAADLDRLARQHGCRLFYLSQDSVAPRALLELARAGGPERTWRWSSDLRPEPFFDDERCGELFRGGALSVSIGLESGAPRVLALINKGLEVEQVAGTASALARAGIAVEAMCFTGFPTENGAEALATLALLARLHPVLSLFVCGEFALTRGSRVAAHPADYGIREVWHVSGDELRTGLFYSEARPAKSGRDEAGIEEALAALSQRYLLRPYPWAGSLSTAHSMLWYARFGPAIFRELAGTAVSLKARSRTAPARFDVARVERDSSSNEAALWSKLVEKRRSVSPAAYRSLAEELPHAAARPSLWRYGPARAPERMRSLGKRGRHRP